MADVGREKRIVLDPGHLLESLGTCSIVIEGISLGKGGNHESDVAVQFALQFREVARIEKLADDHESVRLKYGSA